MNEQAQDKGQEAKDNIDKWLKDNEPDIKTEHDRDVEIGCLNPITSPADFLAPGLPETTTHPDGSTTTTTSSPDGSITTTTSNPEGSTTTTTTSPTSTTAYLLPPTTTTSRPELLIPAPEVIE